MTLALRAQGLGKTFRLFRRPSDRLKQWLLGSRRRLYREFVALQDVSFDLPRGEVLGIVGRNGAGKSTLLQLLCGTLHPSAGVLQVNGRVAALLELGAGFNPEFTGRENIALNAAILGLDTQTIRDRFDAITTFADIGVAIDQPVKTYSSGMYVRLAFAVATSVEPDILIIDEALSVGDGAFARKSFERIRALRDQGTTILFCSHSLYQVEAFCDRALWLDHGRVVALDDAASVVARYQQALDGQSMDTQLVEAESVSVMHHTHPSAPSIPKGTVRIVQTLVQVNDQPPLRRLNVRSGEDAVSIRISVVCDLELPVPTVAITMHQPDGRTVTSGGSWLQGLTLQPDAKGLAKVKVNFPGFALLKGTYHISVHALSEDGLHLYDSAHDVAQLDVTQAHLEQGVVSLRQEWCCEISMDTPVAWPPSSLASASQKTTDWNVRWATLEDEPALLSMFDVCFGYKISTSTWRWKYRDARQFGMIVLRANKPMAFYGGMPRSVLYMGKPCHAVQIGDVMVDPVARGTMTRKGAFFRVATRFLEDCIGFNRPYLIGFGFPTARALQLAERLGLYARVDTMFEWIWSASPGRSSLRLRGRRLTAPDLQRHATEVVALWSCMSADLCEAVVGQRTPEWLLRRYLEHPERAYEVWLVRQRLGGRSLGMVILRSDGDTVEWLDAIAPIAHWGELVRWIRRYAGRSGHRAVRAWGSERVGTTVWRDTDGQSQALDLHVPANIWSDGPAPESLNGRWWLMGGDTDFR